MLGKIVQQLNLQSFSLALIVERMDFLSFVNFFWQDYKLKLVVY